MAMGAGPTMKVLVRREGALSAMAEEAEKEGEEEKELKPLLLLPEEKEERLELCGGMHAGASAQCARVCACAWQA
jgi:hypothetical protein